MFFASLSSFLLPHITASFATVAAFQKLCGVKDGKPTNMFLHALFTFGAALGNEITFILFLPYLFWEYDVVIARRVVMLWGLLYYVGQSLKDLYVTAGLCVSSLMPVPVSCPVLWRCFPTPLAGCSYPDPSSRRYTWKQTIKQSMGCRPPMP